MTLPDISPLRQSSPKPDSQERTSLAPAIDVHTHFVPENFPVLPQGCSEPTWPAMATADSCCHRHVMVKGSIYRTVTNQCWSGPQRIADMDGQGITRQALSPMPELLSYWMEARVAAILHRDLNEQMAALALAYPDRFSVLAAVPLQDVDLAIAEMEHAATVLRVAGVEIGSNINGRPIGAPEFIPFFEAAVRLGMAVFVHAIRPAGMERLIGPPALEQALGFPNEIGFAAASIITTSLKVRLPLLKIAFSHGGGSLAMLLPRLQHAWHCFPALRSSIEVAPVEQAKSFYYDTLVYDRDTLLFLLNRFGEDALMVGTDYPFSIMESDPLGRLLETGLDTSKVAKLRHGNAEKFLSHLVGKTSS